MEKDIKIEYRNWLHGQPPKRIKLDVDGWAGDNTHKVPQPWHCKPYADANTYGCEIVYSWQTTCTVTCDDKGKCHFEGDFKNEIPNYLGKTWHPFASFAPFHFGYVAMIDIKTPPDHNLFILPHPRVFSDRTGTVPIAVPGMLEMDWWPEIFFMVFKAPLSGQKLIFKHGDPVFQFLVVPKNIKYSIEPMSKEEGELRATRQHNLEEQWNRICTRIFYCEDGEEYFDNKYKILSNIARKDGLEAAGKIMDKPDLIPHWQQNPQVIDHRPLEKQSCVHHAPWSKEELEGFKQEVPQDVKEDHLDQELSDEYDKFINTQVEQLLTYDDPEQISDSELDSLIVAFKRQKRKLRQERSLKLKAQSKPVEHVQKKKKLKGEVVLGYEIEKLK